MSAPASTVTPLEWVRRSRVAQGLQAELTCPMQCAAVAGIASAALARRAEREATAPVRRPKKK